MQQILVYADSLSWGIVPMTRRRLPFHERWPGVLEGGLLARGTSVRVIEDCLNGRRTVWEDPFKPGRNGLLGLAQRIETHSPLALVMLMLGTNDFQSMHPHNAWHAASGIAALVSAIRQAPIEPGMPVPEVLVIVPPPIETPRGPITAKFQGAEAKSVGLAAAYRGVVDELGCHFFDAGSVTPSSRIDGVHLDADRHRVLGEDWSGPWTGCWYRRSECWPHGPRVGVWRVIYKIERPDVVLIVTWIIDPLDGTSNFAAGVPWFGVLIAVLREASPVVGVLYLPALDDLYVAERGAGTLRNGRRVSVSTERALGNVLWAYGMDVPSDSTRASREVAFLASLLGRVRNIRATNSLLDAALTADGRFGGMVNFSTKVWDIAAPSLIVEEAGGAYTDLRGDPVAFDRLSDDYGGSYAVVAGAPTLHRQVVDLIAQSGLLEGA